MAEADGAEEAKWRRLLRQVIRGRRWSVVSPLATRGERAERRLREAAIAGDMVALRVLAGPGPGPDFRFNQVWVDLVAAWPDTSDAVLYHLRRTHARTMFTREYRLLANLSLLVLRPAEDELAEDMREVVAAAAALSGHPLADIARRKILAAGDQDVIDDVCELAGGVPELVDFCLQHELAPSDPMRAASFWLQAGKYARYRAVDPQGLLASRAYAAGDSTTRARFRRAAIDGGLFDLLRQMNKDCDESATALSGEWLAELSAGLTLHKRWNLLWELVIELSSVEAAKQSRRFPADWRPRSAADQRRYAALRSAPADLAAAAAAPNLLATIRFDHEAQRLGLGRSRAAVISRSADRLFLDVYAVPGGELLGHRVYEAGMVLGSVVPCEDGNVVVGGDAGLWCLTPHDRIPLHQATVRQLAATAEGWAALSESNLLIGSPRGELERHVRLDDLGFGHYVADGFAVSAGGTLLAIANRQRIVVIDHKGHLLGAITFHHDLHGAKIPVQSLSFLGDSLITAHREWSESLAWDVRSTYDHTWASVDREVRVGWTLVRWSVSPDGDLIRTGGSFASGGTVSSAGPADYLNIPGPHDIISGRRSKHRDHLNPGIEPVPIEADKHLSMYELPSFPSQLLLRQGGELTFLDFDSRCGEELAWIPGAIDDAPFVVPGGSLIATCPPESRSLRLYDLRRGAVLGLLNRPMSEMTRTDLDAVRTLPGYEGDPYVQVLRGCLEHRWRGQPNASTR